MSDTAQNDQTVNDIDKAIQRANARKANKGATTSAADGTKEAAPKAPRAGRPKLTDEEKAARVRELEAAKVARATARAAKRDAAIAARTAPHLKKVNAAAQRLGTMDQATQLLFNEATASLSAVELNLLATHILHHNRAGATERALQTKLVAGQAVKVTGGDPRYIGMTGTVEKAQRIRAYINVPGSTKAIYVFSSDVEVIAEEAQAATA